MTSRLGTGKSLTVFYSVGHTHTQHCKKRFVDTLCRVACLVVEQRRGGPSDDPGVAGGTWLPAVGSSFRSSTLERLLAGHGYPLWEAHSEDSALDRWLAGHGYPLREAHPEDSPLDRWLAGHGYPLREAHPEDCPL